MDQTPADFDALLGRSIRDIYGASCTVGRCRFTVSKPVLKAPMDSALETIIR